MILRAYHIKIMQIKIDVYIKMKIEKMEQRRVYSLIITIISYNHVLLDIM